MLHFLLLSWKQYSVKILTILEISKQRWSEHGPNMGKDGPNILSLLVLTCLKCIIFQKKINQFRHLGAKIQQKQQKHGPNNCFLSTCNIYSQEMLTILKIMHVSWSQSSHFTQPGAKVEIGQNIGLYQNLAIKEENSLFYDLMDT